MRCFLSCFSATKSRKTQTKTNIVFSSGVQRHGAFKTLQPTNTSKQEVEENTKPMIDSKNKHEEQVEGNIRRKVTFDLNVKTHEEFPTQEIKTQSDSSTSSVFSYPPRHRYHNGTSSDDGESVSLELLESDDQSDSLFSISIGPKKHISASEIDEKEVNSPITIDLASVLNPLENIPQRNEIESRKSTPLENEEKENINTENSKQQFSPLNLKSELDDIAVDTSLSSWLVGSETIPISRKSPKSVGNSPGRVNSSRSYEDDRPILGALTVEELKVLSATTSYPRRTSRSRSPDEVAIIGTVGSYWKPIERGKG